MTQRRNSNAVSRPTDVDEAIDALRANRGQVVMSVGTDPEDPVLLVYYDPHEEMDCRIVSTGVGGWSEGITEPVCAPHDDFLREFLGGDYRSSAPALVLIEEPADQSVARGDKARGCTCGTPPFAPPEPSADCPHHAEAAR